MCRTCPGPPISVATYTTAGATGRPTAACMRAALSTPFCRLSTHAPGARCGASWAAVAAVSVDLTHTSTRWASATAATSVLACTGTCSSNAAVVRRRPSRRMASTCAGRPTSVTGTPARASMPP